LSEFPAHGLTKRLRIAFGIGVIRTVNVFFLNRDLRELAGKQATFSGG